MIGDGPDFAMLKKYYSGKKITRKYSIARQHE